MSYDLSLNLTRYANELGAFMVTHAVFAAGNRSAVVGSCGRVDCRLGAGVQNPGAVIDQMLADPSNGYGVTAANPGNRQFPKITTPSNPK